MLGQQLIRRLGEMTDYEVMATGRDSDIRIDGVSCGYTPMDITEQQQVQRVFHDFEPGVVVNCAAMTEVDRCEREREACWQVNVDAVSSLAKACRACGARLVQLSTDFVFDGVEGPYVELDRPNPVNFYGRSKLAAENIVRQLGLKRWSIVRTVLVYGQGKGLSRSNIALWIIRSLAAQKQISLVTDQFRSPTYAPDLAEGIERLIRRKQSGVFHMSGREILSIYDFAGQVADVFGFDRELIKATDGTRFKQTAPRPPRTGFIILKAETELGFKPRTLYQALRHLSNTIASSVSV